MLGDNLTLFALATAKAEEKQQLIMIIFSAKLFCFEGWLLAKEPGFLFLEYGSCFDVAQSWTHETTSILGDVAGCVWGVISGIGPAHPPQWHTKSLSRHFHFPCTVQAYAKGWETTFCFFYNWAQRYKNLILSPFMLPIKLQMLLLNGVPLMHIIEWVISQPPALWYYRAKCCLFPMLKHFLLSFQLLLCMNFPEPKQA